MSSLPRFARVVDDVEISAPMEFVANVMVSEDVMDWGDFCARY